MKDRTKSEYSAGLTGCGYMKEEMESVLPLLMSEGSAELLRNEIVKNELLGMPSEVSRKRAVNEFVRRYNAVPPSFWGEYLQMSVDARKIAMFYVIVKAYRIVYDFQTKVVLKKWKSMNQQVSTAELVNAINDVTLNDESVATWTDKTKTKVASAFCSILRKIGMMQQGGGGIQAVSLPDSEWRYYVEKGEGWFLEACLLQPYEIKRIKNDKNQ